MNRATSAADSFKNASNFGLGFGAIGIVTLVLRLL